MTLGQNPNVRLSGECEVCEKKDIKITCHYNNMWFCDDCWTKEQDATRVTTIPTPIVNVVQQAKHIDESIQIQTDMFNAATVSIVELKKAIDSDESIVNKPYALAETLRTRFLHFKDVEFEAKKTENEAVNQQKAIQVYLNNLANQLHADEREKLKLQDLQYKPASVKPTVKSVTTRQTRKTTKLDKVELRKFAAELGVSEFTLQMLVVQKGITVEAAANLLRRTINESKSESN